MKNRSATWWPQKENAKRPLAAVGGVALDIHNNKKIEKEAGTVHHPKGFRCGVKIYEIRSATGGQELSTVVPPLGNLSVRTSL